MLLDQETIRDLLPFWKDLRSISQKKFLEQMERVHFKKGVYLHAGGEECSGLFLIKSGRIRAYSVTEEGKEVTLFRLLERDVCIFSAACSMKNIDFDIQIVAETDVEAIRIPAPIYEMLSNEEIKVAQFTRDILSARMSDIMWVLEKILFTSFDKRLAYFLLEEAQLEDSLELEITHEKIANHLGSAREVVSRMLKYFAQEEWVKVERGRIILKNEKALRKLADRL